MMDTAFSLVSECAGSAAAYASDNHATAVGVMSIALIGVSAAVGLGVQTRSWRFVAAAAVVCVALAVAIAALMVQAFAPGRDTWPIGLLLALLIGVGFFQGWYADLDLPVRAAVAVRDVSDPARLRHRLEALPRAARLAFMLYVCDRMKPAFDSFARDTGFDGALYHDCLDHARSHLSARTSASNHDERVRACLERAPDTEASDHPLTSAALNFALSVRSLMSFLSDGRVDHAIEAAALAGDTTALAAQQIAAAAPSSLSYAEIMRHPSVRQEARQQDEYLTFLAANVANGMSPVGRGR